MKLPKGMKPTGMPKADPKKAQQPKQRKLIPKGQFAPMPKELKTHYFWGSEDNLSSFIDWSGEKMPKYFVENTPTNRDYSHEMFASCDWSIEGIPMVIRNAWGGRK